MPNEILHGALAGIQKMKIFHIILLLFFALNTNAQSQKFKHTVYLFTESYDNFYITIDNDKVIISDEIEDTTSVNVWKKVILQQLLLTKTQIDSVNKKLERLYNLATKLEIRDYDHVENNGFIYRDDDLSHTDTIRFDLNDNSYLNFTFQFDLLLNYLNESTNEPIPKELSESTRYYKSQRARESEQTIEPRNNKKSWFKNLFKTN
jgi:hypothetical protein